MQKVFPWHTSSVTPIAWYVSGMAYQPVTGVARSEIVRFRMSPPELGDVQRALDDDESISDFLRDAAAARVAERLGTTDYGR